MGVRGLSTFLDINSQLLTDLKLCGMNVIIDGNNLFHFLYNLYNLYDGCGGDYDSFASAARSFFTTLQQCNVEAFVVFDGPYNPKEKKMQISIKRAKDRIGTAFNISAGCNGRATPILCQDVFISVLQEMDVKYATCEGEADPDLAALSNKYNWPVMTNDSDFFIYNLRAGVILLDYVNLHVREKDDKAQTSDDNSKEQAEGPTKYIAVQIYHFSRFHEHFSMDMDLIALFGTLFGNDRVGIQTFEPFFAKVRLSKVGSYKLFSGQKQAKMLGILHWLEGSGTLERAIERILICYKLDQRARLRETIIDSVNSYKVFAEPSAHLVQVIEGGSSEVKVTNTSLRTYAGHPLPSWFCSELYQGKVSSMTINAMVSRKMILLSQPENFSLASAHDCAKSLRQMLYGLIVQYDRDYHGKNEGNSTCSDTCPSTCQKNLFIEEIDRELRRQKWNRIEPQFTLDGNNLPSFGDVPDLGQVECTKLLCSAFGVDPEILGSFPKGLEFYFLIIRHWIIHAQPKLDILHLYAVIMSVLKLYFIDNYQKEIDDETSRNNSTEEEDIIKLLKSGSLAQVILNNMAQENVQIIQENLKKYINPSRKKNQSIIADTNALHMFAQLQACMFAAQALNQALGSPITRIPIARVYNGTLIFNLYRDLRGRKNYEDHLIEVIGGERLLILVVYAMKNMIMEQLETGVLALEVDSDTKRSKKKRASKVRAKAAENDSEDGMGDICTGKEEDKKSKLLAKCEIVNRFDCLMLDE